MFKSLFKEEYCKKKYVFVCLAMNNSTIQPDTIMTDHNRDPDYDYMTRYEHDDDMPDNLIPQDWLAELRNRLAW